MLRNFRFSPHLPPVCRLGLATRGNTALDPADVHYAVERGVNYLNWCGHPDGLSCAVAEMGDARQDVVIAWQLQSSSASTAERELERALQELQTDYIDVVTFYYVESEREWLDIVGEDGAYQALARARDAGTVRLLGLTSHQRSLAARIAAGEIGSSNASGRPLDMLMLRYNAAHRGAERDVFPITDPLGIPVVVYTCLRWGALMAPTLDDPAAFAPPPAKEWYRFALANESVAVAIAAPNGREELDHDMELLDDWRAPSVAEFESLTAHGERVYANAGSFP